MTALKGLRGVSVGSALTLSALLSAGAQAQSYSKTELITYEDNTTKWVVGQTKTVTDVGTGLVESSTVYDPATALPTSTSSFGKLASSMTYNSDGTLATVRDGLNQATTLSNWKRGIPQKITYADGKFITALVDNNGWVTQVTDEVSSSTCYSYDAMGRLATIEYPNESTGACDVGEASWKKFNRILSPVASTEYGIAAGHWRETAYTGNATKITYYDGLWRPLLVREYDAGNQSGTERFTRTTYDADGRVGFASYPSTTSNPTTGTFILYDALGRVTSSSQDSELGPLTTTTTYNTGFTTTVTNPKGYATTTTYLTWDQPTTDLPLSIVHPESARTTIQRDAFGKPLSIRRFSALVGQPEVTRWYVYDAFQQLCKSIEPETGATVMDYDGAGNLAWSASGLNMPDTSSGSCVSDRSAAYSSGRRSTRTYNNRNRLIALTFPDGNGNQTWTYHDDGKPYQVSTQNAGNTVTNAYTFNKRRLPLGEAMVPDSVQMGWSLGYAYNTLGHVISEAYPAGVIVSYSQNALGQTTSVSASSDGGAAATIANGATYFPNGALKQFNYGNGIVHTMIQNARQLPSRSTDGSILDLATTFDMNGNVTAITDYTAGGQQTRSMGYDQLDRLLTTSSPMFGAANYVYDNLDNLTQVAVSGGSAARNHYYCYNTANQLEFVRNGSNCATSGALVNLSYDVQGNVLQKTGTAGGTYTFDYGNRLRTVVSPNAPGVTYNYRYDAQGRRVRSDVGGGSLKYGFYAMDGRLIWQRDEPNLKRISNIYLAGSLVAEYARPIGAGTVSISYFHTDALGSPIAKTNSSGVNIETSEYEPYGKLLNRPNDDRAGYTGHVMDAASGLTYMQQRYYDPQCGCFLSVDPVAANPNTGASFNRYAYANNNPYKFKDPDGRQSARIESGATEEQRQAALDERLRRQGVGNRYTGQTPAAPAGSKTFGPLKSGYVPAVNNPAQAQRYQARSPENRTIQIGLKVSGTLGPIAIDVSAGVAGDARGNVALYSEAGGGAGARGDAYAGFTMHWTNARTVNDLAGQSYAGSAGGGFGPYVSGDASYSPGQGGSSVKGFGFTIGAGAGGGGSATVTETTIRPILED